MFLGQIALSLYHKLNSEKPHVIDNTIEYEAQLPDGSKQWCVVLWNRNIMSVSVWMCAEMQSC